MFSLNFIGYICTEGRWKSENMEFQMNGWMEFHLLQNLNIMKSVMCGYDDEHNWKFPMYQNYWGRFFKLFTDIVLLII